ncbi:MAG: hypothetical protein HOV94_33770 [Saccharothrix sp.]|nr:hypothetical protein [Saccharothrix sp.]
MDATGADGTSGGVTTLVRTVKFAVGPAIGGFGPTAAVLVAITAPGMVATAARVRVR